MPALPLSHTSVGQFVQSLYLGFCEACQGLHSADDFGGGLCPVQRTGEDCLHLRYTLQVLHYGDITGSSCQPQNVYRFTQKRPPYSGTLKLETPGDSRNVFLH